MIPFLLRKPTKGEWFVIGCMSVLLSLLAGAGMIILALSGKITKPEHLEYLWRTGGMLLLIPLGVGMLARIIRRYWR